MEYSFKPLKKPPTIFKVVVSPDEGLIRDYPLGYHEPRVSFERISIQSDTSAKCF